MSTFLAELIGTALLILLGDGVVANVLLNKSKAQNAGWIVVTAGWAFAVTFAVYAVGSVSGAHLNPAVTIAMLVLGKISYNTAMAYIVAQMIGAFIGGVLVWITFLPHWAATEDKGAKLGVFCTAPAIRHTAANLITEIIGTAVLLIGVLAVASSMSLDAKFGWDKSFAPCLVGLTVFAIGVSLGGPTGYAINPARDLGPRLAHAVLPIAGKGGSDWGYAWIPVVGPIIGGVIGAMIHKLFF